MDSIEKYLERKFVEWCKSVDAEATKGYAALYKGIPDRVVVLPNGGGTVWVEFKGGTTYQLTAMQRYWKDKLMQSNPNRYFVVDSKADLEQLIRACERFMAVGKNICKSELMVLTSQD